MIKLVLVRELVVETLLACVVLEDADLATTYSTVPGTCFWCVRVLLSFSIRAFLFHTIKKTMLFERVLFNDQKDDNWWYSK